MVCSAILKVIAMIFVLFELYVGFVMAAEVEHSLLNSTAPPSSVSLSTTNTTDYSSSLDVAFFVGFGIIFALSVSGNALVMHVVRTTPSMHTSINMYIANMACSDIISTIVCVPFSLQSYKMLFEWLPGISGRVLCNAVYLIFYASFACSTFNLAAIAVDRWLAITKPLYHYSMRVVKAVIVVIWTLSLAFSLPVTLGYTNKFQLGNRSYDGVCYDADRDGMYLIGVITMSIACYVIPLSIATVLYTLTGCRLHKRMRKDLGIKSFNHREQVRKSSFRASKMMATVIAVFALCWGPFFVYHIGKALTRRYLGDILKWWYRPVCFLLASANAAINPCLYVAFNENYRRGFKHALICRKKKSMYSTPKFSVPRTRARTLTISVMSLNEMIARNGRASTI